MIYSVELRILHLNQYVYRSISPYFSHWCVFVTITKLGSCVFRSPVSLNLGYFFVVLVHCTGYLKSWPPSGCSFDDDDEDSESRNLSCLVAVGRVETIYDETTDYSLPGIAKEFISRHSIDGKFIFVDQRWVGINQVCSIDSPNWSTVHWELIIIIIILLYSLAWGFLAALVGDSHTEIVLEFWYCLFDSGQKSWDVAFDFQILNPACCARVELVVGSRVALFFRRFAFLFPTTKTRQ